MGKTMTKPAALIETPRLTMRQFVMEDAEAVYRFSSNPEVVRYTGDEDAVKSLDDARHVIEKYWLSGYRDPGFARYALIHKQSNELIGFCGIKHEPLLNRGQGGVDIGYRMLPEYWGKGLATEAVSACLRYARETLGINCVYAEVMKENVASIRVLEKAGMVRIDSYEDQGAELHLYRTA
ncbi:GNAT family N-acetyltransferase [Shewanella aquimarina]|uniref:GNAT family N-acetyltransferase n=1 Tax=Shewanella aquimarina TaxID=260365 RepID=UPI002014AAA4|nr:GNAT family N-acetyltransferase [Shewanella aquimarina]MCL2908613.1 GNAT family N-acetyltransferase [Shewanella aquimarina]